MSGVKPESASRGAVKAVSSFAAVFALAAAVYFTWDQKYGAFNEAGGVRECDEIKKVLSHEGPEKNIRLNQCFNGVIEAVSESETARISYQIDPQHKTYKSYKEWKIPFMWAGSREQRTAVGFIGDSQDVQEILKAGREGKVLLAAPS
jgi:hypothetical protein